jgi:hypothetical protein
MNKKSHVGLGAEKKKPFHIYFLTVKKWIGMQCDSKVVECIYYIS